jgi:hypothetical protein
MSLLYFVLGLIIYVRQDVPPAILGGTVRYFVGSDTARRIAGLLIAPFVMDMLRLCILGQILPYSLLVLYIIASNLLPLVAVIDYYSDRSFRPSSGDPPYLVNTDIPTSMGDQADWIAHRAYFPMLLLGLSLFVPLNFITAPLAIILTTQAIRRSNELQIAAPQRQWAQAMRVLSVLALIVPTACIASVTIWGDEIAEIIVPAGSPPDDQEEAIQITAVSTDRPVPTATPTLNPGARDAWIAYLRDGVALYVIQPDGTRDTFLASTHAQDSSWSPDGKLIATITQQEVIGIINLATGDVRPLSQSGSSDILTLVGYPTWSPDGTRLAYICQPIAASSWDICLINVDGTGFKRITDEPEMDAYPVWLDNHTIYFLSLRSSSGASYYTMRADGSNVTSAPVQVMGAHPQWSPDGTRILYSYYQPDDEDTELFVMNADGSDITQLTDNSVEDFAPSWSPDGTRIVFCSKRDGENELYIMDADGSNIVQLTDRDGTSCFPIWQSAPQ